MDLCLICLRSDRRLIRASNGLVKFHEQLCEFSVSTLSSTYCNECHHLLRKFQKFKEKCFKALEVYENWLLLPASSKKRPLNTLCDLLPPSTFGVWIQNPMKIIECQINCDNPTAQIGTKTNTDESKPDCTDFDQIPLQNKETNEVIYVEQPPFQSIEILDDDSDCDETKYQNIEKLDDETDFDETPHLNIEQVDVEMDVDEKLHTLHLNKEEVDVDIDFDEKLYTNIEMLDDDTDFDETPHLNTEKVDVDIDFDEKLHTNKEMLDDDTNFDETPHLNTEKVDVETDFDEKLLTNIEKLEDEKDFVTSKTQIQATAKILINELNKPLTKCQKPTNKQKTDEKSPKPTYKEKLLKARELNNKELKSMFDIEYFVTKNQRNEEFHRRKTYKCYIEAEYKCEICYVPVKNEKYLKYHLDKWHTERANKEQCEICKVWVTNLRSHDVHNVLFKCKLCPLVTRDRVTAVTHSEWHSEKKYRCEICDNTYKSRSSYYCHMGRVHRNGNHVCTRCGRGFRSAHGLRVHMYSQSSRCASGDGQATEGTRRGAEGVPCEDCDVTFPSVQVYEAHMHDVHKVAIGRARRNVVMGPEGKAVDAGWQPRKRRRKNVKIADKKYRCKIAVQLWNELPVNIRSCPSITVFKDRCNHSKTEGFNAYHKLKMHVKKEHPEENIDLWEHKKYLCDHCGAGFASIYLLRDHINVHTGALPYSCDICDKAFRSQVRCNVHRLRHFPGTFECKDCGKKFKSIANRDNHQKIHLGKKDYICHICDKSFITPGVLNEHVRGVHENIRRVRKKTGSEGKSTRLPRVEEIQTEEIVTEETITEE